MRLAVIILFIGAVAFFGYVKYTARQGADTSVPVISGSTEPLMVPCSYSEQDLLQGLTAYDEKDGDITDKIMVGHLSRFYEDGICKAEYVVFDSSNQPAVFTREIRFVDYQPPRFELSSPLVFVKGSKSYASAQIGAVDMIDGDISSFIRVLSSDVDYSVPGHYDVGVEITNSFGDYSEIDLPVHIIEASDNNLKISLTENIVYLRKEAKFNTRSYIESVTKSNGEELEKNIVSIESNVDTDKEGCYEVKYIAQDSTGKKGVTWLVVVVE